MVDRRAGRVRDRCGGGQSRRSERRRPRQQAAVALAVGCLAVLAVAPACAADFTTGGIFLPLGHGGRAHALGGAGVPAERDDAAAYWCPSNLAWSTNRSGITLMHAQIFPDVGSGYETLSYAHRFGTGLGVEGQLLQPSRWALGVFVGHMGLDFDTSGWSENRIQASGAVAFNNFTTFGAAVRYLGLSTDFDSGNAQGGGFDLSVSMLLSRHLFFALIARDVFTRVKFDTGTWQTASPSYDMGLEYRAGRRGSGVGQLTFREGTLRRADVGLEWRAWPDVLALRGGWSALTSGISRSFPSAGAGFHFARFRLDYGASFDDEDALETKQRVSLQVDF